jgi:ribosomal protein L14
MPDINCLLIFIYRTHVRFIKKWPLERFKVNRVVIVHTCKEFKCEDDIIIHYDDNAVVLY